MSDKQKNLVVRTITGVIFVAAVVSGFINPNAMVLLFSIITGLTIWEFTGIVNDSSRASVNRFICTVAGIYFFLAMTGYNSGITPSGVFIPYLITLVYLLIAELYVKADDPIANWAYTMMSQLYIALPFSLLNVLAFSQTENGIPVYNYLLPLSVFVFLWINDSGAYCSGSLLGKHKLFPRISPAKSWEGSIGGAVLTMAAAAGISVFLENKGYDTAGMNVAEWIGLALVIVVFGTWGDLVESLFKRTIGIKDSGNILPGHGGMLDRFDSSLLAIPAAVVYLYTLTLF